MNFNIFSSLSSLSRDNDIQAVEILRGSGHSVEIKIRRIDESWQGRKRFKPRNVNRSQFFLVSRVTITRDIKRRSFTQRSKRHFSLFKRISDTGGYVNPFFMEFKNARSRYVAFCDRSPFRGPLIFS